MLTKDLIKLLQKADPEGNTHCCIDNADIFDVQRLPAYYDGPREELIRDEKKKPYYDVVGAKVIHKGDKIKISILSINDIISNDPKVTIKYDHPNEYHKEQVDNWKKESKKLHNKHLNEYIVKLLKKYQEGWIVIQSINKEDTQHWYKWYHEKEEYYIKNLCIGESEALVESGFFKSIKYKDKIIWKFLKL